MIWNVESQYPIQDTKIEGESSNIVRLIQDETVKKNIQFDEISIPNPDSPTSTPNGPDGDKAEQTAGLQYPIIRINDKVFARKEILEMTLMSTSLLPSISVTLQFFDTQFISKNMPKDGDILSLFLRQSNNALQYIRCDFLITSCSVNKYKQDSENKVYVQGSLFIPGFNSTNQVFAHIGTSKEVIREIAIKYGIGFAFNDYENTNDMQNWFACYESMPSFISEITPHIWKDETSFFKVWIDFYYNLCFVNVNKFLLSTENKEEVDITILSNATNLYNLAKEDQSTENTTLMPKLLSNMSQLRNTPFYITKWEPVNHSTAVSLSSGYTNISYNFIHNQNIMNNALVDSFQSLVNIPAYDQNKTDSYIVLRGRTTYNENENPENEQKRVNYDYVNTYIKREWRGVEYMLDPNNTSKNSDTWTGNVHKNYSRAVNHNKINNAELTKMYIIVTCDGFNTQIMRGERVPVYLIHANIVDETQVNNSETDIQRDANRFYSGYYIVDNIIYTYNPLNKGTNAFSTQFVLTRREWPTPEAI
jgi:hypothetical protein